MRVIVALEHRFDRTPDGAVWTQTMFAYSFWIRYLEVFDQVRVVARVRQVASVPSDWKRADGDGVTFAPVPYYIGLWQYLLRSQQVNRAARNAVNAEDAVILRAPSRIGASMKPLLLKTNHPFGLEVVADPFDVFSPGGVKHLLRPLFRWYFPLTLRRTCAEACAISYVTEKALQRRYPPGEGAYSTYYSDVELSETAFVAGSRSWQQEMFPFTLITVASLAQMYKAPDVLIDAVAVCVREGLDLKLIFVGDGKYRPELEERAAGQGIADRVCFRGQLSSGDAVRTELDRSDLFVLPSWQEGLPRAMVEAMARGLPCIGSTVGGIPELLPVEDLVSPGDVAALASKIREVVTNPERMAQMSARNLQKAKDYREDMLRDRRRKFYQYLKEKTQSWLNKEE